MYRGVETKRIAVKYNGREKEKPMAAASDRIAACVESQYRRFYRYFFFFFSLSIVFFFFLPCACVPFVFDRWGQSCAHIYIWYIETVQSSAGWSASGVQLQLVPDKLYIDIYVLKEFFFFSRLYIYFYLRHVHIRFFFFRPLRDNQVTSSYLKRNVLSLSLYIYIYRREHWLFIKCNVINSFFPL